MDRHDYIESIVNFLKGITGINFQLQVKEVFRLYYQHKGFIYEMPDFYGGDDKNDGWVKDEGIFYQIFAPTRLKNSLSKEMQEKFEEDLRGLLKKVYNGQKWQGNVKKFIFIVNTFDNNLPHDSDGFYNNLVTTMKGLYNIDFDYLVTNMDYVRDCLYEIDDIDILKRISSTLKIRNMIDYNAVTETMIIELIEEISGGINRLVIGAHNSSSYERVSSVMKITINSLDEKRDEIESIIAKLDVVDKAIKVINQDVLTENKFERVKKFIISRYHELSLKFSGVELYENLLNELVTYIRSRNFFNVPMKFLIVYVFDKCDIFERE